MSRIENRLAEYKAQGRKALVTFVMAGDPDIETSTEILKSLPGAGADLIEIGMPFTDPMADGPAIQAAGLRALEAGGCMDVTLQMVRDFRAGEKDTPLILMGYFNPVFAYGLDAFVKDASEAGVDGLIIVDLPPEEDSGLRAAAGKAGLDVIRLVTPTTGGDRLQTVLQGAGGFLYYVSITGVTGAASANISAVSDHLNRIRAESDLPLAVGFGIKTPADAAAMAETADAVVVGSAIVQTVEQNAGAGTEKVVAAVSAQVSALADSLANSSRLKAGAG